MKRYVLTQYKGIMIALQYADRILSDLHIYDGTESNLLGRIAIGRVKDLVPNIGAAFVELDPNTVCFFSLTEKYKPIFCNAKNSDKVCCGDLLLLQVNQEGIKTKAPAVTSNIGYTGRYVVLDRNNTGTIGVSKKISDANRVEELKSACASYVNDAYGIIVRTQAENADTNAVVQELKKASEQYLEMLCMAKTRTAFTVFSEGKPGWLDDLDSARLSSEDEIITDSDELFNVISAHVLDAKITYYDDSYPLSKQFQLDSVLDDLMHKTVWLKSGASIVIEPCETMTVIDVNTAKAVASKKDKEQHYLEINMEAAREIARQLRIRNISGMILVDFINMKDKSNQAVLCDFFEKELQKDPNRTQLVDVTGLGLVELTRKKKRRSNAQVYYPIWRVENT